jgi:putative polyhydroxyalkanoate system protein
MADIELQKKHKLGMAKAKTAAKKVAADMEKNFDMTSAWEGNTLVFQRAGVKGNLVVTADNVSLDVTLGFLLKAFKPKIEEQLKANMNKLFA